MVFWRSRRGGLFYILFFFLVWVGRERVVESAFSVITLARAHIKAPPVEPQLMDCIKPAADLSDGSLSVPLTVVGRRAHIWETRLRILNHNKISHPKAAVSGKVRLFSISLANPLCVFKWRLPPYSRASLAQCDLCRTTLKERNATLPMAIYAVDAVHLDTKCNIHLKCLLLLKSLVVCAGRTDVICFDSASLDCFKFTTSILRESLMRFILRIWTKLWV